MNPFVAASRSESDTIIDQQAESPVSLTAVLYTDAALNRIAGLLRKHRQGTEQKQKGNRI